MFDDYCCYTFVESSVLLCLLLFYVLLERLILWQPLFFIHYSIEFDRDDELFATAGVSKQIKVFEYSTVRHALFFFPLK